MTNTIRGAIAPFITAATVAAALATPVAQAQPSAPPTVVMVHGAWADTSSWSREVKLLEQQGIPARATGNPLRNLITDAASVASFVHTIDGPVVLVGHSYGGSVITEAAATSPNVKALVYVDGYAPEVGESASTLNGEGSVIVTSPPDRLFDSTADPGAPATSEDLLLKKDVFFDDFASDLTPAQKNLLWATQRVTASAALSTPNTAAAWRTIPSWAFISTGDRIISPASKQFMAQRANAHTTTYQGGSHLSLVSHPEAVMATIAAAVAAVT